MAVAGRTHHGLRQKSTYGLRMTTFVQSDRNGRRDTSIKVYKMLHGNFNTFLSWRKVAVLVAHIQIKEKMDQN